MTKPFRPMLAASEAPDLAKLEFPLIGQPKFDGIRCVVLPDLGPVSRTLKPIPNAHVRATLADFTWHDGEIVTYTDGKPDELNTVQSKIMSADGAPEFTFHTFDHVQFPAELYGDRYARIEFGAVTPWVYLETLAALEAYEETMVAAGWEGVILRKIASAYKFGRSTVKEGTLLKMKRFHDDEASVIGFVELMTNTNEQTRDELGRAKRSTNKAGLVPAGTLGALKMKWKSGVEFELGSGFTAKQRQDIWHHRDTILGQFVTFKFQRVGPKGAPLLPIFKAFRAEWDFG